MSRESAEKHWTDAQVFASESLGSDLKSKKFPVFSLFNKEFDRRDGFDRDCTIRHTVCSFDLQSGEGDKCPRVVAVSCPMRTEETRVISQKLNPNVLMMEPTENRYRDNAADRLCASAIGRVFV